MAENPLPIAVYAITRQGAENAARLAEALGQARLFLPERLGGGQNGRLPFGRLAAALAVNWDAMSGHVVFAAAGIVVRAIAPLLASKKTDPAVVVADQEGRFAISLLAGHLGGANVLAQRVARVLGGQAVVTTASDGAGLPALEVLAREAGLAMESFAPLSRAALALVEGDALPVVDPEGWLLPRLAPWPESFRAVGGAVPLAGADEPLVWVGWRQQETHPAWLLMRPPALVAGLGCNRGTPAQEIKEVLARVLAENQMAPASLAGLASVVAKRDEEGLLRAARDLGLPIEFYKKDQLAAVSVPNPSAMVLKHMGVESVCEAAAILAADKGELLVPKVKSGNVTVAMAKRRPPAA